MVSNVRSYQVVLAIALPVWLSACASPLSTGELRALSDAEARWARRGFQDYTFETMRSCFCDPLVTQWARVEVRGGVATRVVFLETGAEVSRRFRDLTRTRQLWRPLADQRAIASRVTVSAFLS
jgi:hypothetical protein